MSVIKVFHLKKTFKIHKKSPGILSVFKTFFSPKIEEINALKDISFEISRGELVGFIGPNGAGKTTTLKCLSGLLYPTSGVLSVLGFEPFVRKYDYLKKISLIMGQKNQLWWDLPAIDTFKLNKEIYEMDDETYKKNLGELVYLLQVEKELEIPVRKLSLGQRMKMELVAALLHHPEVLFLDEPTIGLDVVMQKNMRDFISRYNKEYNSTIILTSHYMADVKSLCKRIIVIDKGRIIYDGYLDKLVNKYANHKIITLNLKKTINPDEFAKYGEIKKIESSKIIISVKKEQSLKIATSILKKYPVEDFNIEDPEIDEVIRTVFNNNKQ